jgi:hypothetical protein
MLVQKHKGKLCTFLKESSEGADEDEVEAIIGLSCFLEWFLDEATFSSAPSLWRFHSEFSICLRYCISEALTNESERIILKLLAKM